MKGLRGLIYRPIVIMLAVFFYSKLGLAVGYKDALQAYADQDFRKSYKIAVALVPKVKATERSKVLVLAAAAVLELDRESLARGLFKRALFLNPDTKLPRVVKSQRVYRYFEDVRMDRNQVSETAEEEEREPVFNQYKTYIPLGINQMLQKKYLLGAAFGTGQILAIIQASKNFASAKRVDELSKISTVQAIETGNDINPIFIKYINDNNSYAAASRRQGQLFILAALGLYAGSIAEAGINPPPVQDPLSSILPSLPLMGWRQHTYSLNLELLTDLRRGGLQLSSRF